MLQITEQFWSEISSTSKRKKSFCSAFVVFLRETIGLPILTYTFIIISGAAAAAASTPTLFSPVIADNNHPPLSSRSTLCYLCRGEHLLRRRGIQAAEAICALSRKMVVSSSLSCAAVGVMRRRRWGPDGRRVEGGDVRPPVVPGDDLDRPANKVAAVFGPCPVVVPREHPALNAPARHRGVNGVRLRRILQGGGELSFDERRRQRQGTVPRSLSRLPVLGQHPSLEQH